MKKALSLILALVLCLSLCACGTSDNPTEAPETTASMQSLYEQLVEYASKGQYKEGIALYNRNPELENYEDAADYYMYCGVMEYSYKEGKIGYTYKIFSQMPKILNVENILLEIKSKLMSLEGEWRADNGKGAYLYLVIKGGYAALEVVSYADAEKGFTYTDDDLTYEIKEITYDDGSVGLAISDKYSITYFKDDLEIMLVKFETEKYGTFNGVYEKIIK